MILRLRLCFNSKGIHWIPKLSDMWLVWKGKAQVKQVNSPYLITSDRNFGKLCKFGCVFFFDDAPSREKLSIVCLGNMHSFRPFVPEISQLICCLRRTAHTRKHEIRSCISNTPERVAVIPRSTSIEQIHIGLSSDSVARKRSNWGLLRGAWSHIAISGKTDNEDELYGQKRKCGECQCLWR